MNKQKIFLVILIILIVLLGSYICYDKIIKKRIQNRYINYYNQGVRQVAYEQITQGIFFYIDNNNTIQSITINQLCLGTNLENASST